MSLFTMPANVTNRLKKLQCDFLWGGMGIGLRSQFVFSYGCGLWKAIREG